MFTLYLIVLIVAVLASILSGGNTIRLIWKQDAGSALGAFIAFGFNCLTTFVLFDAIGRL